MEERTQNMTRKKRTVTLPDDVLEWIDKQIEVRRFSSLSHALEYCVYQQIQMEKKE
ncbi:unnamed protein product [marine sediment metagenome]|uniref:Uncharacterized protein n=1 Tax=marine sediment metagenome TaxID=412755 RepID=X1KSX2_9ZZZZ